MWVNRDSSPTSFTFGVYNLKPIFSYILNFKPRDPYGRIGTPRGYGGFMHTDWVGFKGRNIISMDGYGGQVIAIVLDLKRVVVINAIHHDYDWKKIVRQVMKDG